MLGIRSTSSPPPIGDRLGLLDEGIPAAALRATPKELSRLGSTDLAMENNGGFGHCEL